ncbi:MAG: SRPBCC family protein [Gemmatimonadetes bacterium]|nr:SRPBCC family protein [Gemmatimonadota bacterium]MBK9977955.1 SRPBCC family protein [Gemmatimonadota bacterium]
MRTLAYLAVLLLGAVAVMYMVGRSLPVAHLASRGQRFDAPLDSVWRLIADVGTYASWRTGLSRVELLTPLNGRTAWREYTRRGGVDYVAEEMVEGELFVARITTTGLPYGGRWRYELNPDTGGTRVTITEEGEIYNPIFRCLMKYVIGETRSIEAVLAALDKGLSR